LSMLGVSGGDEDMLGIHSIIDYGMRCLL
jgi:hypothetical protein